MKKRDDYNGYMSRFVCDRYILLKLKAIEYKGGECQRCGYNKCYSAMDFHHRDPAEKDMVWSQIRRQSLEMITKELDKCDLLCANCHREEHHDPELLKRAIKNDILRKDSKKKKEREKIKCGECEKKFRPKRDSHKYCSMECQIKGQVRIQWPDDLPALVKSSSKLAVAKSLGVSDKAVAKRLKNHH